MNTVSPSTIAAEAREALSRITESSKEHISRLVREGFINASGQVTTLLGGTARPESAEHGGPPTGNGPPEGSGLPTGNSQS